MIREVKVFVTREIREIIESDPLKQVLVSVVFISTVRVRISNVSVEIHHNRLDFHTRFAGQSLTLSLGSNQILQGSIRIQIPLDFGLTNFLGIPLNFTPELAANVHFSISNRFRANITGSFGFRGLSASLDFTIHATPTSLNELWNHLPGMLSNYVENNLSRFVNLPTINTLMSMLNLSFQYSF